MIPTVQLSGKTDYGDDKMIGDCLSPGTGEGMDRQSAKDICGSETVLFVTSTLLLSISFK